MTRDTTQCFVAEQIAPLAARVDVANRFACDLWRDMGALGLHRIAVAEANGNRRMPIGRVHIEAA